MPAASSSGRVIAPSRRRRDLRRLAVGLAFLLPNIAGFLAFTAIPLLFSLAMAFTDWNLQRHNPFRQAVDPVPIRFVGLENFRNLLFEPGTEITWQFWRHLHPQFWTYLGNSLYLMIGLPFSIIGSLAAASMLHRNLRGRSRRHWIMLLIGACIIAFSALLIVIGMGASAMTLLIVGLLGSIVIAGVAGGSTVYRTLFYLPCFTAGVATFLLWKKLFSPTGPLNQWLAGPLNALADAINGWPPMVLRSAAGLCVAMALQLLLIMLRRLRSHYDDGDVGWKAAITPAALLLVAPVIATRGQWLPTTSMIFLWAGITALMGMHVWHMLYHRPSFRARAWVGNGSVLLPALAAMCGLFLLTGIAGLCHRLPALAADGLAPPNWLTDPHWAKPSLIIMSLWAAVGSNSMLLYLAALGNVPQELYEAADMDGASAFTRFWNITWPQLAPTTFFLVVMGIIGGLQGGFEMARVMTNGGPAGQTTTLSYFIYTEGFETGRLGYASAVSWTLFAMVLAVTLFNGKFGSRYVND